MASAQISETTRPAYLWSGSEWIPIGDGGGGGLSLESASLIFFSQSNATVTYATKEEVANIVGLKDIHETLILSLVFFQGF